MRGRQHGDDDLASAKIMTVYDPSGSQTSAIVHDDSRLTVDRMDGRWWLLHTKPRNEKALARDLGNLGVSYFLPLTTCRRRKIESEEATRVPLFPGYLFLCGNDEGRINALRTQRVVRTLEVVNQDALRHELRNVERMILAQEPIDVFPGIQPGRRCRVIKGVLVGLEGVVLRRRGAWRVYVVVEILGQSAELEIDPEHLEPIE